jgi:hypothetical protein
VLRAHVGTWKLTGGQQHQRAEKRLSTIFLTASWKTRIGKKRTPESLITGDSADVPRC